MQNTGIRIGALAKRTGISVRTLHHYDQIGLLSPSRRSETGHRIYTDRDIALLQRVLSLRQLGFSLQEIRSCLANPEYSLLRVIELHAGRLREQVAAQSKLIERLEWLAGLLRRPEAVPVEEFLTTIEEIRKVEKYYTPEQLEELRQRREEVGEEGMRRAETEWAELMAQVRAEKDKGTDPADESVQHLAQKWMDLINQFTGGNPGIEKSLRNMYQQETTIHGMDDGRMREMGEYISKALASSKDQG